MFGASGQVGAVRVRVQRRRGLDPILVRRIDVHDQRTGVRGRAARIATIGLARQRVGDGGIREREDSFRVEVLLAIALRHGRLLEAVVERDAVAAADPVESAVEHLFTVEILIEPQPDEVVHGARRLR